MKGIGLEKKKLNNVEEDLGKTSYLQCCILEKDPKQLVTIQQTAGEMCEIFDKISKEFSNFNEQFWD